MSTVLVTGASGFVGGAVVRRLVREGGHEVAVLVRPTSDLSGLGEAEHKVRKVYGDLTDPASLARATAGVDLVVHSAARVDERGTRAQFVAENRHATEHLLAAARHDGVRRFVFVSSPSALMDRDGGDQIDIDESVPYPRRYLNYYSETKAAAERAVLASDTEDMRTVALRPRAIWGAGDRSGPIVRMLARTQAGALPDLSFGRTVYASLCHVENVAEACLLALRPEAPGGRAYFVADAERTDVWGFLAEVARRLGYPVPTRKPNPVVLDALVKVLDTVWRIPAVAGRWSPPLSGYVVALLSRTATYDTGAAARDLGYRPIVDRETGMNEFLTWLQAEGGAMALTAGLR
ncbi:NAD-dependent epimerase/dehydratase family protein [Nocardia farcinica]|uniref:NAD-dependent epimerase/dehydratase family protein n=1 Tax=Nocardia farcinica TaxID=37329 RepID=UPI0024558B9A|nr:NAD-dependent epimerase/dehydratase family protein [Nocardia farcinica]